MRTRAIWRRRGSRPRSAAPRSNSDSSTCMTWRSSANVSTCSWSFALSILCSIRCWRWNYQLDPDWSAFARMVNLASDAVKTERPEIRRVLGGISPVGPDFVRNMQRHCVLSHIDVVALHGFPLDWNHWTIDEWPAK